jgi:hypothetical protein
MRHAIATVVVYLLPLLTYPLAVSGKTILLLN